jgi:hypothetical protein
MMAPEKGPNRLNMKFTDCGRKVVIHLVRGLPPKIKRQKDNYHYLSGAASHFH